MGKRRKGEPVVRQNAKSKTTELSTLGSAFVQASDNEPSTSRRHSARLKPNTSSSSSLISSYEPSDSESAEGTECRVRERSVSNAEEAKLEKRKRGRPPGSRNRKLTSEKANSVGEKRLNATGNALPGRETEFNEISTKLGNSIKTGQGLCLYISGVPGTGKTATVQECVKALQNGVPKVKPFNYVEINGMKLSDPGQVYSLLWRKLGGKQTSSKLALRCLQEYFKKAKQATVVLLDELDALLKRKHSVLYHFFEWTGWRHSRLIIIAISNTMDLPERFLSNRIVSRMGLCRINFKPYSYKQLQDILQYRLPKHHHLFHPDAAEHIGRKVSSVSGDARRALAFANRTVDMIIAKYRQESLGEPTKHSISLAITLRVFNDASCGNPASVIQGLPKFQIVLLESILMAQKASDLSFSNVCSLVWQKCRLQRLDEPSLLAVTKAMQRLSAIGMVRMDPPNHLHSATKVLGLVTEEDLVLN